METLSETIPLTRLSEGGTRIDGVLRLVRAEDHLMETRNYLE